MESVLIKDGSCEYNTYSYYSPERRKQRTERRVNQRKAAVYAVYRRRRQSTRRNTDTLHGIYVDTHERGLWYISTGLMLLCVLDALFTTILIYHGSEELNPILNYLLQIDLSLFLAVKFLLTGACISFLVLHKHHRLLNLVSCYHLLIVCFALYSILICYELSMIQMLPSLL